MSEKSRSTLTPCDHEPIPDLEEFEWPGRRCWICGRLISLYPRLEWDGTRFVVRRYWMHRLDETAREKSGLEPCEDAPLPPRPPEPPERKKDRWICTSCGSERFYPRTAPGKRGGPEQRALDRRYGWAFCRKAACNPIRHKVWNTLQVDKWREMALFRHESAPNPEQPVQDDPSLLPFLEVPKRKAA